MTSGHQLLDHQIPNRRAFWKEVRCLQVTCSIVVRLNNRQVISDLETNLTKCHESLNLSEDKCSICGNSLESYATIYRINNDFTVPLLLIYQKVVMFSIWLLPSFDPEQHQTPKRSLFCTFTQKVHIFVQPQGKPLNIVHFAGVDKQNGVHHNSHFLTRS